MAGTNSGFNAATVRTALHLAMTMGAPTDVSKQVTFVFLEEDTYSPESPVDEDPYSWTQTPTTVTRAASTKIVPVAVEFATGAVTGDGMGEFDASRATLTILDTDWVQVSGADEVRIGGITYLIDAPGAMPIGLFDMTVWTLHLSARA